MLPSVASHVENSGESTDGISPSAVDPLAAAAAGTSFFFPDIKLLSKYKEKYPPIIARATCSFFGRTCKMIESNKKEATTIKSISCHVNGAKKSSEGVMRSICLRCELHILIG